MVSLPLEITRVEEHSCVSLRTDTMRSFFLNRRYMEEALSLNIGNVWHSDHVL